MKFLDWQTLQPKFVETIASSRFSTQAASFLGLSATGLPDAAVIKAVIAELTDAVAKLGGGAQGAPGQPSVTLSPLSLSVSVGLTVSCIVTVLDANQQPVSGVVVGLSTDDSTIAVVEDTTGTSTPSVTTDASGSATFLVSGVAQGTTNVTAVANGITSSPATVVVGAGAVQLALLPTSIAVPVGGQTPLTVHLTNSGNPVGGPIVGQVVSITSSNPAIATVPASVTTDSTGAAQVLVTGVAAGSVTITASALSQNASSQAVVSVPSASPKITIAYTDFSTPYQSDAAAQRQMAFIASKTNHKWKVMGGRTPSGGYPTNVRQIVYTLVEEVKCYDDATTKSNIFVQQGPDYEAFCAAHSLNPESGYLHYIAGANMLADTILSIDASGNCTMKYDTQTRAKVYAVGDQVTIAGNSAPGCNGTFTVIGVQAPLVAGGSAIIQCNMTTGQSGTGGTMTRVATGDGSLRERYRTGNAPFTPSWHIAPGSSVRQQYELDRLARILASSYTGYGVFVDGISNNVFPAGATTLEYNPANSTQYHNDLAGLFTALRATMGAGPWRYQINTANYNDSGITQLISAAGSSHMESIITDHSPSQWPGTDQSFVATQLANGSSVEILNDVSMEDSESGFGPGPYVNDPLPPSANLNAMAYVIQSIVNAYMVWNGVDDQMAINLWNALWTKPTVDTGGIDNKWLGMLDYEFGVPTAASVTLVTGVTDPLGQGVSVHTRAYGNNLVVYRATSSGTTSWGDAAAYTVTLPASTGAGGKWQRVRSDGTLDVAISTIDLHPMMGALLVPAGGSVTLSPATASVAVGQSVTLGVTVLDSSGSPVSGQVVAITSSVPADVTVPASVTTDSAGTASFSATGVAAGSSNVSVSANGITSGVCAVTVTAPSGTTASDIFAADSITGLANSASVASWTNDADNTRSASEANSALQPLFKTAQLNGLPVVYYPSSNPGQMLQFTALAHSAFTWFFLLHHPSGASSSHHGVLYSDPGYRLQILDASAPYTFQFTSHRSTTDGVWQSATTFLPGSILEVTYDSASVGNAPVFKLNGTVLATTLITAPVGAQTSSGGTATIGNDPSLGANDGVYTQIGEIRFFDGVLGAADESNQGKSLGTKWGVANSY